MDQEITEALRASGGVLIRRHHLGLARKLDRRVANGQLVSPLPGVITSPAALLTPEGRIAAGLAWAGPDAVVCGLAAARLTFWPNCQVDEVDLATPTHAKASRPGWHVESRRIPPKLVWSVGRHRVTSAALTALDLATGPLGGDIIDRALRTRSTDLTHLWAALAATSGRRGNRHRAALLHDSRDEPWSEAERELHRLLRGAGLSGWATNVWIGDEADGYCVDVLFEARRVIVEVDGWQFHSSRESFEADRHRRNQLVLAGYLVLNFTWRQLIEKPGWVVECIREALGGPRRTAWPR